VESPSLEIFQPRLDAVLCPLLWVTLLGQGTGLGDPQRALPAPARLGFCDSVTRRVSSISLAWPPTLWAFSSKPSQLISLGLQDSAHHCGFVLHCHLQASPLSFFSWHQSRGWGGVTGSKQQRTLWCLQSKFPFSSYWFRSL